MAEPQTTLTDKIETLEALDKLGADGLNWLGEFSANGIEFIEKQAPEICHEIIVWGIAKNATWAIALTILIIITLIIWHKLRKQIKTWWENTAPDDPAIVFYMIAWCIPPATTIGLTIGLFASIYNIVYISVAPRLYLIDYFTDLAAKVTGHQ